MSKKFASSSHAPDDITDSFRIFADAAAILIWMTAPDKKCVFFNKSWLQYTGRSLTEELAGGWGNAVHPEDIEYCSANFEKAFDACRPFSHEYRLRRADGEYRWILDKGSPVFGEGGVFLGYVGSCTDIHDLKVAEETRLKLQKQLFQSQKMESLGQFSTRVAHDLNNVLSVIRGHLQILSRVRTEPDKHQHSTDMALAGCQQGAQLIQDLLRFGNPTSCAPVTMPARRLVEKAVEFVGSIIDKKISLRVLPGGESDKVKVDENQLLQVFTNLIINAQHAMPNGGNITISFANRNIPGNAPQCGRYVEIAVQDTGDGIPPANLPHIFEPFFTTKPAGIGTGLGLSVAYSIIQNHFGWIEASSPPGAGARLIVVLPVV